jgi:katanin p60 ATPase-containing subunit A1
MHQYIVFGLGVVRIIWFSGVSFCFHHLHCLFLHSSFLLMASHHLENVPSKMKIAREMALLGNYDSAIEEFAAAQACVNNFIAYERPCTHRRNWENSVTLLAQEYDLMQEVKESLEWFTVGEPSEPRYKVPEPTPVHQQPAPLPIPVADNAPRKVTRKPSVPRSSPPTSSAHPSSRARPSHDRDTGFQIPPPSAAHPHSQPQPKKPVPRTAPSSQSSARASAPRVSRAEPAPARARPSGRKPPLDNRRDPGPGHGPPAAGKKSSRGKDGEPEPDDGRYTNEAHQELVDIIEGSVLERAPNVSFEDIAELQDAKRALREALVYPLLMPKAFQGARKPPRGVLLYGPPGTGKTMLAKAVATQCKTTFFNVRSDTLTSKFRGDSEKLVHILFAMARHHAPSVIFIDECDAVFSARGASGEHEASRRVKSDIAAEIDGAGAGDGGMVVVLGATNNPWDIDKALLRRFEKHLYVPLPGLEGRKELLQLHLKQTPMSEDVDLHELASLTAGYSGADLAELVRDAAMGPFRRLVSEGVDMAAMEKLSEQINESPVTQEDLMHALGSKNATVTQLDIDRYEKWAKGAA